MSCERWRALRRRLDHLHPGAFLAVTAPVHPAPVHPAALFSAHLYNKVGRNTVTSGGPATVTVTEPIPCYRSREGLFTVCLASGNQRRSCGPVTVPGTGPLLYKWWSLPRLTFDFDQNRL